MPRAVPQYDNRHVPVGRSRVACIRFFAGRPAKKPRTAGKQQVPPAAKAATGREEVPLLHAGLPLARTHAHKHWLGRTLREASSKLLTIQSPFCRRHPRSSKTIHGPASCQPAFATGLGMVGSARYVRPI